MPSPRPSLKAPEARIGAQVPGSANRRKSLGIRFVADEAIEQVRFIPPHNGEPEVCGRIAPNQSALVSSEKRKRTPSRRYSDAISEAISEGVEEEEVEDDAPVNRIGCVGHTGPIPKFVPKAPENDANATNDASAVPASSPSTRSSSRKRSLASPVSTGASKRSAVSFAIGQAEVTDDVAGTPVEQRRRGSSGFKRKGTPHAPPSRVDEEEEEMEEEDMEETEDQEEEMAVEKMVEEQEEEDEEEEEEDEEEVGEEDVVEGVDVTVVEEGILGSGGTGAPSSVAGTELCETDADASGSALGGDTVDDIPVFRLGDVGNTGPIPHYSPACKASPMSTIKSAVKSSPSAEAPPSTGGRSTRSTRSTRSRRSSAGVGGRAPANTPAAGPAAADTAAAAAAALVRGLEGVAGTIAQTPGGHAVCGAVARILAMEAEEEASLEAKAETPAEASPAPTMLDVDVTREEIISAATPFVERAEAAAAAEAAEAAAEAGAAAAARAAAEGEDEAPAFDFDEAFAVDAALAVEGIADVEAAVEIEQVLEAARGKTPEKVEKWLEKNLAEAMVEAEADEAAEDADADDADAAAAATPASAVRGTIDPISPATVIVKARGGSAGGRLHGGLSSRVAQIHRALRATRAALIREKQKSAEYKKLYLAAAEHASEARDVAAAAAAEVAAATEAAVKAAAELQEARNEPKQVIELKIVVAETAVPEEAKSAAAEDDAHAECDAEKCKVCGVADERDALLCDGCDGAFHMGCLKPPRKRVPAGDWFCKPCAAERKPAPKRRAAAPAEGGARRSTRARS
jgi:hypothetical protein